MAPHLIGEARRCGAKDTTKAVELIEVRTFRCFMYRTLSLRSVAQRVCARVRSFRHS